MRLVLLPLQESGLWVHPEPSMNAIQISETGGPEVLELADLPIPQPGPGQVLIRVEATGVNFIEIYFRKGVYKTSLPFTPGSEAAGTVEELGPGVTGFAAGDAVASASVLGSYAEYALVPAAQLSANQDLYDRVIDAFSMRSFVPTTGFSGHDQFFATFARFGGLDKRHTGEWIDEVASRAAAQNQQYLELMVTPPFSHATGIARDIGWSPQLADANPQAFAQFRQQLLDQGLRDEVAADREEVRAAEVQRKQLERCGTAQAAPACRVEVRYIWQVLRDLPPELVFAQTLLGFETVEASIEAHDPGFVGINFVRPEDDYVAMRDYTQQMKMIGYLHSVYPNVHISLHAGELALGLVPPEGLRFHIRQAVELAHAERIGHGVDVMHEDDAAGLLKELAAEHVMVEINLSSNEGILDVKGAEHPFPIYRAAHVPVALSTDDEGVSRIDLTHEYVRAALDYHLTGADGPGA